MRHCLSSVSRFFYRRQNIFISTESCLSISHPFSSTSFTPNFSHGDLPLQSANNSSSLIKMNNRVPMEISEIPLTGFPLNKQIEFKVDHISTLSNLKADLVVVAVQAPAKTEDHLSNNIKDHVTNNIKEKTETLVSVNTEVDRILQGELSNLIKRREFTGAEGKTINVRLQPGLPFEELCLLGLGWGQPGQSTIVNGFDIKKNSLTRLDSYTASKLGKPLHSLTSSIKAKSVVVVLESSAFSPNSSQAFVESFFISNCPDERFKSQSNEKYSIESLTILVDNDVEMFKSTLANSKQVSAGIQLARELTAAPANYCNPETLAKAAVKIAKDNGLKHTVLGLAQCVERKMGCYLAVNQGSIYEPQFIHLTYTPEGDVKKRIVFIGKGICMDTGGYNLKTLGGIETMKMDMGGAAAVFGCASIIGAIKPKNVEVHFICAAAENMIDSKAYRPGDIVTSSNGQTVEVGNTDAEGRLTLADALVYAETEIKPDAILDCATLTGACITALGGNIAAVYSQDNDWMNKVLNGAKNAGSPIWPMPLFSDYKKLNEGKCADLANVPSTRTGGSITAALFLNEFVKDTPWAHIDLAGPVYDSSSKEYTGYGAKLLSEIIFDLEKSC